MTVLAPGVNLDVADVQHFQATAPVVTAERVLRIQGYTDPTRVRRNVRAAVDGAIDTTHANLTPAVAWRRVAIESLTDTELVLAGKLRFECRAFRRFLEGADSVVSMVTTIGDSFDTAMQHALDTDDLLEAVLMQSAGWLAVEAITREFTRALRDSAVANGQALTRRMSPGYQYQIGDQQIMWELEQQETLFRTFGDSPIAVRLLESSAMLPKMSRSGLIGLRLAHN